MKKVKTTTTALSAVLRNDPHIVKHLAEAVQTTGGCGLSAATDTGGVLTCFQMRTVPRHNYNDAAPTEQTSPALLLPQEPHHRCSIATIH